MRDTKKVRSGFRGRVRNFYFQGPGGEGGEREGREKVWLPCRLRVKQDKDVALNGGVAPPCPPTPSVLVFRELPHPHPSSDSDFVILIC